MASGIALALKAMSNDTSLLVPIVPWNVAEDKPRGINDPGKQPGRVGVDGQWRGLSGWQFGCSKEDIWQANRHDGNGGLLLGMPRAAVLYLALDIDLEPKNHDAAADLVRRLSRVLFRSIVNRVASYVGHPVWVRHTEGIDWRGVILFQIPDTRQPGGKDIYRVTQLRNTNINQIVGKWELLAHKNQAVIAGTHTSGNKIKWFLSDNPAIKYDILDFSKGIPVVASREVLDSLISVLAEHVSNPLSFNLPIGSAPFKVEKITGHSGTKADTSEAAAERAAPSVERLIDVLNAMKHPMEVPHHAYVTAMLACVGCLRGLDHLGLLTDQTRQAAEEAAIRWAARWENPPEKNPTDEEQERTKFYDDFNTREVTAGWRSLVGIAEDYCGLKDLRSIESLALAQSTFLATEDEPPPSPAAILQQTIAAARAPKLENPFKPRPRNRSRLDLKTADMQIADWVQTGDVHDVGLQTCAIYHVAEQRWLTWDGPEHGWRSDLADKMVGEWIEDGLHNYVAKFSNDLGNNDDKKARILSHRQMNSVRRILEDRLAKTPGEIDQGHYIIQTPLGAFDLRRFNEREPVLSQRMSPNDQILLYETRLTKIAPANGNTPLFDSLINLLCLGDEPVINYLWHYLGYILLGAPIDNSFLIIHGPGGNGKSVLVDILREMLGTYAVTLDRSVVLDSGKQRHPTDVYAAKGKRLWCISELPAEEKWHEERLKAMTGGDRITARGMHQNASEFQPEGSFLMITNNVPHFYKVSNAITRRVRMIHASQRPECPDPRLKEKILTLEAGAVLRRIMGAARRVYDSGIVLPEPPKAMVQSAQRYLEDQDSTYAWFRAKCEALPLGNKQETTVKALRESYDAWKQSQAIEDEGDNAALALIDVMSPRKFIAVLRTLGAQTEDHDGKRLYLMENGQKEYAVRGIRLKR